jgi:hypothetical protein
MAGANLPAKIYKKTTPTELRLIFDFEEDETGGFIDIAQCLSALNRRFYRQGLYYYVNSIEVQNSEDGYVDLSVIPDTWMTQQAHKRAFRSYQEMNAQSDTPRPKYHDFKVFMDTTHRNNINGMIYNKMPITMGALGNIRTMQSDEWVYSQFVSASGEDRPEGSPNQWNVHMVGDHQGTYPTSFSSVGLIQSYKDSRTLPPMYGEPEVAPDNNIDPIHRLFESGDVAHVEEISQHLDIYNDTTPYDRDNYVGQNDNDLIPLTRLATSESIGRTAEVKGACVPFGLIRVSSSDYNSTWRLILNIAPGTYHGVYAERV